MPRSQGAEVVKVLTGAVEPLYNNLFVHDSTSLTGDVVAVERDAKCPACGKKD